MFECSCLFEMNYKTPKPFPRLEKNGLIIIHFNGNLNSHEISRILEKIHFILCVYKRACRQIVFICDGVFMPRDMFVYVLFETFIYTLRARYNYDVSYRIEQAKNTIFTPGLNDSQLIHFYKSNFDLDCMEKTYKKIHTGNHFRRIVSNEKLNEVSILMSELKVFFSTFLFKKDYGIQLARVVAELVDNASEHASTECLIDIFVSNPTYQKSDSNEYYYALSMVVIDFSNKKLSTDVNHKIHNLAYGESKRYGMVNEALANHQLFFQKDCYEEEDFFNIVSFQDKISGRDAITETGGTGLTELIKSIEDKAEAHRCYVLSGNKGLWFEPEYLKYNDDGWIGFNEENDFLRSVPDRKIIVRSEVDFPGTGYNFVLVVKKEDDL